MFLRGGCVHYSYKRLWLLEVRKSSLDGRSASEGGAFSLFPQVMASRWAVSKTLRPLPSQQSELRIVPPGKVYHTRTSFSYFKVLFKFGDNNIHIVYFYMWQKFN